MLAESNVHLMKIQTRRGESLEKKGFASNLNMDGKGLEERKLKMILRGGGISNDPWMEASIWTCDEEEKLEETSVNRMFGVCVRSVA